MARLVPAVPITTASDGMTFTERYPRFLATTETIPAPNRLDTRHRAIVEWNADILRGRRVLDIGAHDGRWSFAAIEVGAAHVFAIEARQHLVDKALRNFGHYRPEFASACFVCDTALERMRKMPDDCVDVAMCLGFFYHTLEHMALLIEMKRLGATHIILDTGVTSDEGLVIRLSREPIDDTRNSVDYARTGQSHALVGIPSRAAVVDMLDSIGYGSEFFDWHGCGIVDWSNIEDYRDGARITVRATRRPA